MLGQRNNVNIRTINNGILKRLLIESQGVFDMKSQVLTLYKITTILKCKKKKKSKEMAEEPNQTITVEK